MTVYLVEVFSTRPLLTQVEPSNVEPSGVVPGQPTWKVGRACPGFRNVTLWTFLARSHCGGVYNAEMKRLMLDYAFQFVDREIFLVGIAHIRSQPCSRLVVF